MTDIMNLTLEETCVIEVVIEKEITTPNQYPLSLNALTTGCNQKSNRDPVLELDESSVQQTVDELVKKHLVTESGGFGSRVSKYQHRFCNTEFSKLQLDKQELDIICVLFLRSPQTPGELRTRTNRLCKFGDVQEVESALQRLAENHNTPPPALPNTLVAFSKTQPARRRLTISSTCPLISVFCEFNQTSSLEAGLAPRPVGQIPNLLVASTFRCLISS